MGATLAQIEAYLNAWKWNYIVDPANSRIIAAVRSEVVNPLQIVIELKEQGRFCWIYVPRLLHFHRHPYRELVLSTPLSLCGETKMLRWEYDALRGEVRAGIELPREDAELESEQFYRCMSGLVQLIPDALPRLKSVMATGVDPVQCQRGEQVLLMLKEKMPREFLDELEPAIAAHYSRPKMKQSMG
ncbi:hypothetical protein J0895_22415 [Phormidium pseudopriestleyi FRX01]|uniref:Uncharacterized protein n=1 Tax=Phormidium pseudopriestleyi FRX01 TaxID=1759528 RepID=A0ABS3FXC2_9CYAN|nr:hypothetical protein [Phormidium pseudopriestleyi]MBO0351784.1 hypothetical protein [Phormidium pseudopriestleyi FRX01]